MSEGANSVNAKGFDSLNEDEKNKLDLMMSWTQTAGLFKGPTSRNFMANFLSGCKFDVEKAQTKMSRYSRVRANYTQWFRNRDLTDENMLDLIDRGFIYRLKERDAAGRPVVLVDCTRVNSKVDTVDGLIKLGAIIQDSILLDKFEKTDGCTWVLDAHKYPMAFILQSTPALIYQVVDTFMMSMPIQIKEAHVVNVNFFTMAIIRLFLMFLSPKMRQRINIYGKTSVLYEQVPIDCLPVEYGGFGGSIQENIDKYREHLLKMRQEFLDNEKTFLSND